MGLVGVIERSHLHFRAYHTTAGTTRSAELRPELPAFLFPPPSSQKQAQQFTRMERDTRRNGNISEQQGASTFHTSPETLDDEFGDDDFKDQEVMKAGKISFSTVTRVQSADTASSTKHGLCSHR